VVLKPTLIHKDEPVDFLVSGSGAYYIALRVFDFISHFSIAFFNFVM
jgi:hypothetical protein